MQVNKTKFERNGSLEYYHLTCIGKNKTYKLNRSIEGDVRTNENAFTKLMLNRNSSPVLTLATGRVSLGTRFFKKPGNFRVAPSLCLKARLSGKPLM